MALIGQLLQKIVFPGHGMVLIMKDVTMKPFPGVLPAQMMMDPSKHGPTVEKVISMETPVCGLSNGME